MSIRAYRIETAGIVEFGEAAPERLDGWLADEAARGPECGISGFGLYRDERDFIELTAVGNGRFLLHSDRITRAKGWWLVFTNRPLRGELAGRKEALDCAHDYLQLSRQEFESRYG